MKKRKKSSSSRKSISALAGIFAAGAVVGAAFDFSSMFYLTGTDFPSASDMPETTEIITKEETAQQLSAETQPTSTSAEIPNNHSPASPPAQETEAVASQESVSLPDTTTQPITESHPESPSASAPEPETEPDSDWIEAIFLPSAESVEPETDDWMEDDWMQTEPESIAQSSMTAELAGMLEAIAVFWTPSDGTVHLDPACRSLTVRFAGTLEEAQSICTDGWCKLCAEHLIHTDNTVFYIDGNRYATLEQIASSYSYADYLNGFPADAFGG